MTTAVLDSISDMRRSHFTAPSVVGKDAPDGQTPRRESGYHPTIGTTFDVMDFASFVNAGFDFDFSGAPLLPGQVWDTGNFGTTGAISVVAVPEPSTLGWCGIGMALLAVTKRRRAAANAVAAGHRGHNT